MPPSSVIDNQLTNLFIIIKLYDFVTAMFSFVTICEGIR